MFATHKSVLALLVLLFPGNLLLADDTPGHSSHGTAFDSGLRQRPWKMEGIGHTHFLISTPVPEVQEWFDQGNTLLHSFWFEEAERTFRWCLKLDTNCAMAYWGLARTGLTWFTLGDLDKPELKRYLDFLNEAVRREDSVTPRERMYIEAWAKTYLGDPKRKDIRRTLAQELQKIVLRYPDDIEAKSLFALFTVGDGNALGTELVLREVLAKQQTTPGPIITGSTTGTTSIRSKLFRVASNTASSPPISAMPIICRGTTTPSWECGAKPPVPWIRPRASSFGT